jgi:hypothetical protein
VFVEKVLVIHDEIPKLFASAGFVGDELVEGQGKVVDALLIVGVECEKVFLFAERVESELVLIEAFSDEIAVESWVATITFAHAILRWLRLKSLQTE